MKTKKKYSRQKKHISLRRWIYTIIITAGLINIFFPYVVHADIFGYEIQDLYTTISTEVSETNDLLTKAFRFTQISPYEIINDISGTDQGAIAIAVRDASKTVALVVATLLIMVDFFRKSVNFEWSSKWENILIFLIKIIVVKQIVQNADVIIGYVYSGFNYINNAAIKEGTTINFLPYDAEPKIYTEKVRQSILEQFRKPWWKFAIDLVTGDFDNDFAYTISPDAVHMFYPDAEFPDDLKLTDINQFVSPCGPRFSPSLERVYIFIYFLVMKAIAYIIFVIAIGRVFELCIYTLLAPLPLATFASDTTHDVAKNFIKNYISVVLQIAVIVIMFIVYVAAMQYIPKQDAIKGTKLLQLIILISLGLGVTKSGAWSKRICGIA